MSSSVWDAVPKIEGTTVYVTAFSNVLLSKEVGDMARPKLDGRTKAGKRQTQDLLNLESGMKALSDLAWSLGLNGPEEIFR